MNEREGVVSRFVLFAGVGSIFLSRNSLSNKKPNFLICIAIQWHWPKKYYSNIWLYSQNLLHTKEEELLLFTL